MKLYNTLHKKIEDFAPLDDNTVRFYTCGPTVYNHAQIGNLRAYIFADTLWRALKSSGWKVAHVMNYTDVDDKTIRRSREVYPDMQPHEALRTLTEKYIEIFHRDMTEAGNDVDHIKFIRATDSITDMQAIIRDLHAGGFAYIADDGVYFSIETYRQSGKTYGQLLELSASNTSEARIQNDEYDKESVHDFALWKTHKEGEPSWPFILDGHDLSGRPGWHIECSAMSRRGLGQPFDIHTGGVDNIFPHHENEIAQSTAGHDNPMYARFFTHNEHVLVEGKKMAKSAGNFYTLADIVAKGYDPLAFRLLVLQAHYRSQLNFSFESLDAAQNRLHNWREFAVLRWQIRSNKSIWKFDGFEQAILNHIQNDLDTPQAVAAVDMTVRTLRNNVANNPDTPISFDDFTHFLQTVDQSLGLELSSLGDINNTQKQLIANRDKARTAKDWQMSDAIRDKLAAQNIGVRDTDHGTIWYRL